MSNIGGGESFSRMVAMAVIAGIKDKQEAVKKKLTAAQAGGGTPGGTSAADRARAQAGGGAGGSKATTMDQIKAIDIQVDVQELSTISAAGTAIISTEKASAQAILRNV